MPPQGRGPERERRRRRVLVMKNRKVKLAAIVGVALSAALVLSMPLSALANNGLPWTSLLVDDLMQKNEEAPAEAPLAASLKEPDVPEAAEEASDEPMAPVEESEEAPLYSNITDEEIAENMKTDDDGSGADDRISLFSSTTRSQSVVTLDGCDRYDTSARQATTGWQSSDYIILVTGERFPDALTASSLAGAYDCPILLTEPWRLSDCAKSAITTLRVKKALVIGSTAALSDQVVDDLRAMGIALEGRLGGVDRYATQMAIYDYGKKNGLWGNDLVVVASGQDVAFPDALSAAPVAYVKKAPLFLTNDDLVLNDEQTGALRAAGSFDQGLVVGSGVRVSSGTEQMLRDCASNVERMDGTDRYDTSAKTAVWATKNGLSMEGAGFATGLAPWDALGGGALQGRSKSVMMLVNENNTERAVDVVNRAGGIKTMRIFGDTKALSNSVQGALFDALHFSNIRVTAYDVWLERFAETQAARSGSKAEDVMQTLDPDKCSYWGQKYYQYAILSDGFSGNVTADQLNQLIASKVTYQEKRYGVRSNLRETGQYFIDAAKKHNVNEAYLLAHAAIESAWGCSTLAQGKVAGYEGYYNFYGIGAYDVDPNNGGAAMAKKGGWSSPERAIVGAAEWISNNYVNSTSPESGQQNTLYKMRWDVQRMEQGGDPWHQYATSLTWATGIAETMSSCYSWLGQNMSGTGLEFDLPKYLRKVA